MGPLAILVVIVLLALIVIGLFNGLVRRRNRTQEAWSQIDVELKRRHDLVPNLVETVKGYATHERGTFEAVTNARAGAVSAGATGDPAKIGPAENALSQSLRSLFAVAENYPDLKAVQSFTQLQEELTAIEDKIAFARRYYNTSVRDFNTAIQTFPGNLFANMAGFTAFAFYEGQEADREVPKVDFGTAAPPLSRSPGPPPAGSSGPPTA